MTAHGKKNRADRSVAHRIVGWRAELKMEVKGLGFAVLWFSQAKLIDFTFCKCINFIMRLDD